MKILWSAAGQSDLGRLYDFLARHDEAAATGTVGVLIEAPEALLDFPRRGPRLSEFNPREVREYRWGNYLIRYELSFDEIRILRVFHAREDRFRFT